MHCYYSMTLYTRHTTCSHSPARHPWQQSQEVTNCPRTTVIVTATYTYQVITISHKTHLAMGLEHRRGWHEGTELINFIRNLYINIFPVLGLILRYIVCTKNILYFQKLNSNMICNTILWIDCRYKF